MKVILLSMILALVAIAEAQRGYGAPPPSYSPPAPSYQPAPAPSYSNPAPSYAPAPSYKEPGMPYNFQYAVKDDYQGLDFGHQEESNGNLVQGEYYVLLPDTRRQVVTYQADHDRGFVADVKYEGEAVYPAASYAPKSGYQ